MQVKVSIANWQVCEIKFCYYLILQVFLSLTKNLLYVICKHILIMFVQVATQLSIF